MTLTPRLAQLYALKTRKTLTRDINALRKLRLIKPVGRAIKANTDLMLAFPPTRARVPQAER